MILCSFGKHFIKNVGTNNVILCNKGHGYLYKNYGVIIIEINLIDNKKIKKDNLLKKSSGHMNNYYNYSYINIADFWNGDPDIDAVCRMEHYPMCYFDDKFFPISTNSFSPFNQQNTFISRSALKYYLAIPFIGRMDDICPSYYCQDKGFNVIYTKSSVFQDRNEQNLTTNLKNEFIGYENTLNILKDLKEDSNKLFNYLPENSKEAFKIYLNLIK